MNFRVNARADPGTNSGPLTRNLKVAIDGVNLIYATAPSLPWPPAALQVTYQRGRRFTAGWGGAAGRGQGRPERPQLSG